MYWLTKLFVVNLDMNHKLLYIFSFLLLFIACKKEKESNLSLQHIKISGAGTTYYSNQDYNLLRAREYVFLLKQRFLLAKSSMLQHYRMI